MISPLLKRLMTECRLQQKDLAEVLEVTIDRVKSLTSGRVKNLTREESEALIGKLDIRADWLITGEGPMFQADEEAQGALVSRQQAITRTAALINAMPLREFTRTRLCALMTGAHEQDGPMLAEALRHEALGLDFVTRKPFDGATPASQPLPADEQMWLDCYREWDAPVKKRELRRAMGVLAEGDTSSAPAAPAGSVEGAYSQHNSGAGAVQIGGYGGKVTIKKGR